MGNKENLIVKYARNYEQKLKTYNYTSNEIEKHLNIWIKKALEYFKDNPTLSDKEFEEFLLQDNIVLK